ncbi:MAG: hypothetical protein WBQ94_27635 [Terracidiphilus sp.]
MNSVYNVHQGVLSGRPSTAYSHGMRFREKSGPLGWVYVLLMCLYGCDFICSIFWHQPSTSSIILAFRGLAAAGWAGVVLRLFLNRRYGYWDLDSDGLHKRRLESKKDVTIQWDKVIAVRNLFPSMIWDETLSVYYESPASKLGFSHITAVPENRNDLIAALRKFAPQAKFNV